MATPLKIEMRPDRNFSATIWFISHRLISFRGENGRMELGFPEGIFMGKSSFQQQPTASRPPFTMWSIRGCHRVGLIYTRQVRINRNLPALVMLMALALCSTGCGGINASQSVSPASFFLPGLLKADLPSTNAPAALTENSREVALIR